MKALFLALATSFVLCSPTFAHSPDEPQHESGVSPIAKRSCKTHEELFILATEENEDEEDPMYLAGCGCPHRSGGKAGKKEENKPTA